MLAFSQKRQIWPTIANCKFAQHGAMHTQAVRTAAPSIPDMINTARVRSKPVSASAEKCDAKLATPRPTAASTNFMASR